MKEEWKDVVGYEGLYKVSSLGRVKRLRLRTKLMSEYCNLSHCSDGYLRIRLTRRGVHKAHYVHRLVAIAFIGNEECKPFINHKNGVKNDNVMPNLEWCTTSENHRHAFRVLGRKHSGGKRRPVVAIDDYGVTRYDTITQASKERSVDERIIIRGAQGAKTHGSTMWRYV